MTIFDVLSCLLVGFALYQARNHYDEYCMTEFFRPQCQQNEVVLLKNATYGRMRVGRCLTAEEVETHRAAIGDDPRYFGCSIDVLKILDQRCSGKTECDVRVAELLEKNIRPCLTGLMVYLEASYDCIAVVDEKRSCLIKPLTNPTHIISSSSNQRICGTKSQPLIVESPIGQRISVSLIDFNGESNTGFGSKQLCDNYGRIVDRIGKRNVTICGTSKQREKKLYMSAGNTLEIIFNVPDIDGEVEISKNFMLGFEAIGCSDITPPEDTWLKRKDDAVVIGCYSTRQTWQLSCNEGKWIGVLGNCSNHKNLDGTPLQREEEADEAVAVPSISEQEQILAIVAISGCTFAICLVIVCVGVICLRRFYMSYKNQHDYKTLSLSRNPDINQHLSRGITSVAASEAAERDERNFNSKLLPTYSVYVGENNSFSDNRNSTNIFTNDTSQ